MAHRGRLNVLANVIGKSYEQIFREFEGELDPASTQGSGDVKYHLGAVGKHQSPERRTRSRSRSPPTRATSKRSDPVVEGMARADRRRAATTAAAHAVLPVLVHGDAAFAGQGVVAETFNLSEVPGYEVGGTVHVVVNNQLGFTTAPELGRSSVYPTDVAKMVQAPIFHVNGDDPEAAVRVMRLAFEFRQAFQQGRRRRPRLLPALRPQRSRRARVHAAAHVRADRRAPVGARALHRSSSCNAATSPPTTSRRSRPTSGPGSTRAFEETHAGRVAEPRATTIRALAAAASTTSPRDDRRSRPRCRRDVLRRVVDALAALARRLRRCNPKLERQLHRAGARCSTRDEIDWALGRGAGVRLAGARGHAGAARGPGHPPRHVQPAPRRARRPARPSASTCRSRTSPTTRRRSCSTTPCSRSTPRSGFEYGYSIVDPTRSCAGKRSSATSPTARRS